MLYCAVKYGSVWLARLDPCININWPISFIMSRDFITAPTSITLVCLGSFSSRKKSQLVCKTSLWGEREKKWHNIYFAQFLCVNINYYLCDARDKLAKYLIFVLININTVFKILHFIIGRTKKRLNKLKSFKVAKSKDKNLINCGDYDCYGLRIFVRMVVKMMVKLILKVVSKSVKIVLKVLVREVQKKSVKFHTMVGVSGQIMIIFTLFFVLIHANLQRKVYFGGTVTWTHFYHSFLLWWWWRWWGWW